MRTGTRSAVLSAAAVVVGGLVLVPTSASAGPPIESVREIVDVVCEGTWSGGTVEVGLSVRSLTNDARIDLFSGDDRIAGGFVENDVQRDGLSLTASVPLDSAGEEPVPVGSGDVAVSLSVDGEPRVLESAYQVGNVRFSDTQVISDLTGGGTLELTYGQAQETVALSCSGTLIEWTERQTNPDALTSRVTIGNLWCRGVTEDGQPVDMFIEFGKEKVVELYVGDPATVGGFGLELTETQNGLTALVPLFDPDGNELGTAELELEVRQVPGDRDRFVLRHERGGQFFVIEALQGSGVIELLGETVGLSCDGERTLVHEVATSPAGPGATGPVPANDAPVSAETLEPGDRLTVRTDATAVEAEIPFWCYQEPEVPPDELRPGHTVWYAFTGTGGEVTVDTAGSSFNTTLAVYRVDPVSGILTEVACVDDVSRSWQALATSATEAGVQYLVQIGGLAQESGLLKLALR